MADNKSYYVSGNLSTQRALDKLSIAHNENANFVQSNSLQSTDTSIDVRPGFHRLNYEFYRAGEAIPKTLSDVMVRCREAYEKVGIIKSVVDLMTEIAVEGLEVISTHKSTENFYTNWVNKTDLIERAERFANYYLVEGNVTLRRKVASIDTSEIRKLKRSIGRDGSKLDIEPGIIPIEYIFYDPSTIELIGAELAIFSDIKRYGIKLHHRAISKMLKVNVKDRNKLIQTLPEELQQIFDKASKTATLSSGGYVIIPIPSNRLYIDHNKKKDSDIWAKSFIYSILHEVIYNEKLRLAKLAALDGWHNATRVWKLGDHTREILPDSASFSKLANILQHHPGGILDIIWDSMIDMKDFYPPIDKLSGFEENFESMMLGLGVPRTLVGGSESSGLTNMFIGLRNMMKRIDGVRRAIRMWIENEINIITNNLGFQNKPKIKFSLSNLFDQQSYFKLMVDLYDRQILSDRSLLDKIGEHFDVERQRVKEEFNLRESGDLAPKRSPLIQPIIPPENKQHQKDMTDLNHQLNLQRKPMDNDPPPKSPKTKGRPPGSKDTKTRNRRFRAKADLILLADRIQDRLDQALDDNFLVYNNIKNKRQLTAKQRKQLDITKLELLASLDTCDFDINDLEYLMAKLNSNNIREFISLYHTVIKSIGQCTIQQERIIRSSIYAEVFFND